ncbi:MAG: sigma 54-interacting transcriptional regulator, partial [Planctomycetes bacterium]|nr:sigma 54-interacting transcriptional regulator [Planctomycetota bacterium]
LSSRDLEGIFRRQGSRYWLAHAPLRLVAYEAIPPSRRREIHRAIAGWLRARRADEADRAHVVARLARHYYLAGEEERAAAYLLKAAAHARLTGALREAAEHLSRFLEVSSDSGARFEALLSREETWGHLGERARQEEDLEELDRLAADSGADDRRREALLRRALFLDSHGQKRAALEKLREARSIPAADPRAGARLLSRMGMMQLFLSEFDEGFASLEQSLEIARSAGSRPQEAECLQLRGLGRYLRGDYDDALADMSSALHIRRALGDEHRAGSIESNLGLIQLDRGLLEAAEERFKSSLETFRRIGHRRGEAVGSASLGLVYSEMGRMEKALGAIHHALEIRRELGDRHGEGADLGNLGAVWMQLGLFERAIPLIEEAVEIAAAAENFTSLAINEARLAWIDIQRQRLDAAASRLERAGSLAEKAGGSSRKLSAAAVLARLHLARAEPDAALEEAVALVEAARGARMRTWLVQGLSLRASALLEAGRIEEAESASREAIDELDRVPGWLERAHEAWFVRHQVLSAQRRQGSAADSPEDALRRAYTLLREKADALQDPDLRQSYLENIPLNRELSRLHEELNRQIHREIELRERSFYDIASSIHSIVELDPLLDRLLELAVESTHAERGLILLSDEKGEMMIRAARAMSQESVDDASQICRSVIADVASGGKPILATDATSDDRFRERHSIISFNIRTLMCVPMKLRDRDAVVGAVYVDGRGSSSFAPDDLDYLVSFAQLAAIAVENARLMETLRAENRDLRREVERRLRLDNLVASSPAMTELVRQLGKVARTDVCILMTGETGTGKSLIAHAIHAASHRGQRPFVTVDCGALPESLLESELFGHKKGAFSGALFDRVGLIEEAEGGTLFLDEISNTSLDLQAKLLRVLQEGEIRRVGENHVRRVDVRIIAATNTDIAAAVKRSAFREDLYYRLNVISIEVPPLRRRPEDIPVLASHFAALAARRLGKSFDGFDDDAVTILARA